MDIKHLSKVADSMDSSSRLSEITDATYEQIGVNFAQKYFKDHDSDDGFPEAIAKWRYRNKQESVDAANEEMKRLLDRKAINARKPEKQRKEEDIKEELYNLTKQFVYKYWRQYYPQYKGQPDDLVSDFYEQFLTKKSREEGKEENLLDKWDPNRTNLPYLVKTAVTRMLIDRSRTDKGEKNYTEKYDEETGELSLDYLASHMDDDDVQIEDIEFSDDEILELRDKFDEMDPVKKKAFLKYYEEVKNVLAPNFKKLFKDVVEGKVTDSKISKSRVKDNMIDEVELWLNEDSIAEISRSEKLLLLKDLDNANYGIVDAYYTDDGRRVEIYGNPREQNEYHVEVEHKDGKYRVLLSYPNSGEWLY